MALHKLKVIGNGDAFGSGGKYHTCFYLESTQSKFLVDLGATAVHNLAENVNFNDIDLIIISHLHGDHFGGIPFFVLNSAFQTERQKPLTIVGPKGTEERVSGLIDELYKGMLPKMKRFALQFIEYQNDTAIQYNDLEILALPVVHSDASNSHCIQVISGNNKFAYSGDTEWTDNLHKISQQADIFICECTYFSMEREGHLNYLELVKKLSLKSINKVLLTHMGAEMLDPVNRKNVKLEYTEQNEEYNF